jgi:hypothetical protein
LTLFKKVNKTTTPTSPVVNEKSDQIRKYILHAAQSLSDSITYILSDTDSLAGGNLSGFENLIKILDTTTYSLNIALIVQSKGIGCLQILLDHMDHKDFIELCNRTSLGINLSHYYI